MFFLNASYSRVGDRLYHFQFNQPVNTLLQVMEEGRLTDSFGRNIDFRNVILIMTTNVGAHAIKNESAFGLPGAGDDQSYEKSGEQTTNWRGKI